LDWLLVLVIPALMLRSAQPRAFPAENPNLYRGGGAMVPVFLLAALAQTASDPRTKLFIVHLQDQAALDTLQSLYPLG
jgi:hypothetical protein